jgi:hypothetical protein
MKKITENTPLAEILKYPEAKKILAKYNLPCLGCPFFKIEIDSLKIGQVSKTYGIDLKSLLEELNKVVKKIGGLHFLLKLS